MKIVAGGMSWSDSSLQISWHQKSKTKKATNLYMWPLRVSLVTSSAECVCVWIWFGHACYMQVCTSNVKLQVPTQGVVCMYVCVHARMCRLVCVFHLYVCACLCVLVAFMLLRCPTVVERNSLQWTMQRGSSLSHSTFLCCLQLFSHLELSCIVSESKW